MLNSRLRHRIEIQHLATSRGDDGAVIRTWSQKYANVPAEVLTGAGREPTLGASERAETTARITTRWMPDDIHTLMSYRILWQGRTYDIKGISTDATDRRWMRFECTDGVSDG